MIIVTMNDLPGYQVEEVVGEVFGLTVRSRNLASQIGAGLTSIFGGELKGMTTMLADSRQQAIARLVEEAESKGANAIIAMRFDASELGSSGPKSALTARRSKSASSSEAVRIATDTKKPRYLSTGASSCSPTHRRQGRSSFCLAARH